MAFLPPLLPTRLPALPTCLLHTPLTSPYLLVSPFPYLPPFQTYLSHFLYILYFHPILFFLMLVFCFFSYSCLRCLCSSSVSSFHDPRFSLVLVLSSFCTCHVLVSRSSFLSLLFSHFTSRPLSSSSSSSFPYSCSSLLTPPPRHRPLSSFRILCPEPSSSSSCPLVPFLLVPILVHHLLPARQEREALLK